MMIEERLQTVTEAIAAACATAGRAADSVQLVAVTKKKSPEIVREAIECGLAVFGENRVQEAAGKIPLCPGHVEWHMIGHLQSNKVRAAVGLFAMIHSVDSQSLLETIDAACGDAGRVMPVCLQVNVSGEASKSGFEPGAVAAALDRARSLMNVDVMGLMTMPPFDPEPEGARVHFAALRDLRDRLRDDTGFDLPELSMGMSRDFRIAIEEGATMVRLGTVLFGERKG